MKLRALVPLAASAALVLSTGRAFAGPPWLRYGLGAEGGPFIVPGSVPFGFLGPHLHAGLEALARFGMYAEGGADFIVGKLSGIYLTGALLVDYKLGDNFTVGVGPELGFYQVSQSSMPLGPTETGFLYGGRLHFSWYAVRWWSDNFVRVGQGYMTMFENLLTLGFDLRLVGRAAGFTGVWSTSETASASPIAILPTISIGVHIFAYSGP